jgi:hypothetical protein
MITKSGKDRQEDRATVAVCSHVVENGRQCQNGQYGLQNLGIWGYCEPKKSLVERLGLGTMRNIADDVRRQRSIWEIPAKNCRCFGRKMRKLATAVILFSIGFLYTNARASLSFIEGFSGNEFVYDFDSRLDPGVSLSDTDGAPLSVSNSATLFSDVAGASLGNNVTDNQTTFPSSTIVISFDISVHRAGFCIAGEATTSEWSISYYSGASLLGSSSLAIVGHGADFFWEQYSDPITSIDITAVYSPGPTHIDDIHFENVPEPAVLFLPFLSLAFIRYRRFPKVSK